jgi:penicillin amidase
MLGATPESWKSEDAILTILAMFNTLQGRQPAFERTVAQMRAAMPEPLVQFLTTAGSDWDAPASGVSTPRPPIPGPDVIDQRSAYAGRREAARNIAMGSACAGFAWRGGFLPWCEAVAEEASGIGSNNWAVDQPHSASGALVANDMHLDLGVPNIWYRASLVFPDPSEPLRPLRLDGVTLPGLPSIVVGSNGHVAWGFTNSNGDWSDLVRIDPAPGDPALYVTPEGPRAFEIVNDEIEVHDEAAVPVTIKGTIWGPVIWTDAQGREYAQRWVAHDPDVISSDITRPERVRTVDEALVAAAGLGIPNQNFTAADSTGRIGWTIAGAIPRRTGFDGLEAGSWADGARRWDGYLEAVDFPRIVDPESGRIWTANAPVVDGVQLERLGDGGYSDDIRARMIRDRLMAIGRASPADMLDVQLENGALFLDRWRTLVLAALDSPESTTGSQEQVAARREFRQLVETTWTGRASPDSVGYRLVRTFRSSVVGDVMEFLTLSAKEADATFDYTRSPRSEGPVWQLVSDRPMHLLPDRYPSWDALLVAAVDAAVRELTTDGRRLADRTWGEFNRAEMAHPLASAVPYLERWLRMPREPLPGDVFTPRAHSPRTGPSQRLVVSPGREAEGILHMPAGQSAHPLSPHFGDMQDGWLAGQPVPLLPGPAVSTLTLTPP